MAAVDLKHRRHLQLLLVAKVPGSSYSHYHHRVGLVAWASVICGLVSRFELGSLAPTSECVRRP